MNTRPQLFIKLSAVVLLISASYSSLNHHAWAAKMYKWVDANGRISYQDKPPPKSGRLIETSELQNRAASSSPSTTNQARAPITAYTIADCLACVQLMTFLRKTGIPVIELSLQDREVQSRILSLSGKIAAPTLFIGDVIIDDLTETGLITTLKEMGYTPPDSIDPKTTEVEDPGSPSSSNNSQDSLEQEN